MSTGKLKKGKVTSQPKMRAATRKKIMDAMRQQIELMFGKSGLKQAERTVQAALRGKIVRPDQGFRAGMAIGLWSSVQEALKNRPEPTEEELEEFLKRVRDTRSMMGGVFSKMMRQLPPFPPGARPKLNGEQKERACLELKRLMDRGVRYKVALNEVGNKFKVSWRTIQRAWIERNKRIQTEGALR